MKRENPPARPAAQIGGTTWAILRSVHACLDGLNVIYFFPTRTDVLEFSKSRLPGV